MGTLSERLHVARLLARDLSARELDRLAGLREGHTALIESAVRPNIEARTAEGLARVLGVSLDWLIAGTGRDPAAKSVCVAVDSARAAHEADQTGPRPVVAARTATG